MHEAAVLNPDNWNVSSGDRPYACRRERFLPTNVLPEISTLCQYKTGRFYIFRSLCTPKLLRQITQRMSCPRRETVNLQAAPGHEFVEKRRYGKGRASMMTAVVTQSHVAPRAHPLIGNLMTHSIGRFYLMAAA